MQTFGVGEFKRKFSEIIKLIKNGKEIAVSYGKNHEKIAVLVPFNKYRTAKKRKLGLLKKKGSFKLKASFKFKSEDEFLQQ